MKWKSKQIALLSGLLISFCATPNVTEQPVPVASQPLLVLICPPQSGSEFDRGIQALTEAYAQATGLSVIPSSEIAILAASLPTTADPALLCKHAGVNACIAPELEFRETSVSGHLTWISPGLDPIKSSEFNVPLRELSQALYQSFTSLMDAAHNNNRIQDLHWSSDNQLNVARVVKPQTESLLHFSRGLARQNLNPNAASNDFRNALAIDPDFVLAYARLFYTCYESQPYPLAAENDLLSQTKARLDSDSAVWFALAFRDLATTSMRRGALTTADAYYHRSLALLANIRKESSISGALALQGLGDLALRNRNSITALYHTHSAQEALESMGAQKSFLYAGGYLRLGASYLLDNKVSLAVHSYDKAQGLIQTLGLHDAPENAMIAANMALAKTREGDYAAAIGLYQAALQKLQSNGVANSTLYLNILAHLGNAYRFAGSVREAEATFNQVMLGSKALGLDESMIYAEAMYSTGTLSMIRGDYMRAQYLMVSAQMTMARLGNPRGVGDYIPMELMPVKQAAGMTTEEARLLSSYCGAFSYASHSRIVQSRTYEGRLDDTNVFLRDLLDRRKSNDSALNALREQFMPEPDPGGRGVLFVDVGPAIANLSNPGVTAVSLARDFPYMDVVALDLPEQVDIFRITVAPYLRNRVTAFPNLFILAGNGILPLSEQAATNNTWVNQKAPADPNGKPIVLRAANSIDIYESWEANAAAFDRLGRDYAKSPVLYLFNRSILFKPAGKTEFKIIGMVSPAGFDHMYETFNRQGDPAYTIISAALSN
ncbi:MAG: tetratricopeptide repeat protein [Spirochaetia bacterium]|nr:tetratricopeptide repeat protein [Spirochaetia bacterium]